MNCTAVDCGSLPSDSNSQLVTSQFSNRIVTSTLFNSTVTYRCKTGYQYKDNQYEDSQSDDSQYKNYQNEDNVNLMSFTCGIFGVWEPYDCSCSGNHFQQI